MHGDRRMLLRGGGSMWDQSMHGSKQSRAKGVMCKRWEGCFGSTQVSMPGDGTGSSKVRVQCALGGRAPGIRVSMPGAGAGSKKVGV